MPTLLFPHPEVDLARNAAILDSNVLIAAFNPRERTRHDVAQVFINADEYALLVPAPVIVETWGMLASRLKDAAQGIAFLTWLGTPGTATVLPEQGVPIEELLNAMERIPMDVVDAMLLRLARRITDECVFEPPVPIATFDTADFLRLRRFYENFRLYDLNSFELI